ncbi:MAG: hypothetical protein LC802_11140 [Acidobacteria bacterium]|nr:hypothetical protein [Acidobacteriota bacterium]
MRKTLRVSLMIMVLACSTRAGIMPNGTPDTTPTPPPAPASVEAQAPLAGVQETTASDDTADGVADSFTQIMLNLFEDISSLF